MFDSISTDPTSTTAETGSPIDAGEIAARHEPTEPRKKRKYTRRAVAGGSVEDSPESTPGNDKQASVGGGVALSPETRQQVICSIESLIKIVDDRCCRLIRATAIKLTNDANLGDSLVEETKMSETERQSISTLTVVIVEKYNLLGTYAPEAMLGLAVIGYGYRVHSTLRDLKTLAAQHPPNDGLSAPAQTSTDNGEKRNG